MLLAPTRGLREDKNAQVSREFLEEEIRRERCEGSVHARAIVTRRLENFGSLGMHVGKTRSARGEIAILSRGPKLRAVEIFAGAGGLALGAAQAGFKHVAVVELDNYACKTIRENQRAGNPLVREWPLYEVDVRKFNYSALNAEVDMLSAGLPCQPFSLGGKGMAHRDRRDMFGEVVRAARELRPKAIVIENVKGLLRATFKNYFDYLLLALASPSLARSASQSWREHLASLQNRRPEHDLKYDVHVHLVNAADYGVPQWRDRVLIVAFRSDLGVRWRLPDATHSLDSLMWTQWKTREYWKRYGMVRYRLGCANPRIARRAIAVRQLEALGDARLPWKTVRDAIWDLPRPRSHQEEAEIPNHLLNPGARPYAGHSGSLMDEPAKTLKAGSHGVPGGENSLALGSGRVRYFSVRECARLQTFSDDYVIAGPWTRAMRQVGNAVPVALAKAFTRKIRQCLEGLRTQRHPDPAPSFHFDSGNDRRRTVQT
jgi:DNA (cytosine-5)-methyltransferase 1